MVFPAILAALGPAAMGMLKGAGVSAATKLLPGLFSSEIGEGKEQGSILGNLKNIGGDIQGFAKDHPTLTKSVLQGLGGGLMSQMGNNGDMYNMYLQQLMAQKNNNQAIQPIGSQTLPGQTA